MGCSVRNGVMLWMMRMFVGLVLSGCKREKKGVETSPPPEIIRRTGSMTRAREFRFHGLHQSEWELLAARAWLERIGDSSSLWIDPVFREAIATNDSIWILWDVQDLSDTVVYMSMPWGGTGCEGGVELPMGVSFVPPSRSPWEGGIGVTAQVRFFQEGRWGPWETAQPVGFLNLLPPSCVLERPFFVSPSGVCRYVFAPREAESLQVRVIFQTSLAQRVGVFLYRPTWILRSEGEPWASLQLDRALVPGGQDTFTLPVTLRFSVVPCTEPVEVHLRLYRSNQLLAERVHSFWMPWDRDTAQAFLLDTLRLPGAGTYRLEGEILGHTAEWTFSRKSGTVEVVETLGVYQVPLPGTTFTPAQLLRDRVAWERGMPTDSLEWWEFDLNTGEVQHVVTLYPESLGLKGILRISRDAETGWFLVGGNGIAEEDPPHFVLVDSLGRAVDRVRVDTISFPYDGGLLGSCFRSFRRFPFDLPGSLRWGIDAGYCYTSPWIPGLPVPRNAQTLLAEITWRDGFAWRGLNWFPLDPGELTFTNFAWDSTTQTLLYLRGEYWSVWPLVPGATDTLWLRGVNEEGTRWEMFWIVPSTIPPILLRPEGQNFWKMLHAHHTRRGTIWLVRYRLLP